MSPRALSYTPPVTGSSSPMTTPACYNAHSSFFEVLQLYAAIVFLVWVCLYQYTRFCNKLGQKDAQINALTRAVANERERADAATARALQADEQRAQKERDADAYFRESAQQMQRADNAEAELQAVRAARAALQAQVGNLQAQIGQLQQQLQQQQQAQPQPQAAQPARRAAPVAVPESAAPGMVSVAVADAVMYDVVGRVLDKIFGRTGTARLRLLNEATATWNDYNSAYPQALIRSGEAEANDRGFANTTPKERGAFWDLHHAKLHGAGIFFDMVLDAKRAANVATQP